MKLHDWHPKAAPWMPPDYDDLVVYAVRAIFEGKANAGQQQMAAEWLMYVTGASERWADLSYRPGADGVRATDFAEGKRFVGLQVRKMLSPEVTPKAKTAEPAKSPVRRRGKKRGSTNGG